MKALPIKSQSLSRVWILSLFLVFGFGAPLFCDSPIGTSRNPTQTEQKDGNRNPTLSAYRLTFYNYNHHFAQFGNSFAGLTKHHCNTSKLLHLQSKIHVISMHVKLGSHQKKSGSKEDASIYTVG